MRKITESSSVATTTKRSDHEIKTKTGGVGGGAEKILKTKITQNEDGRSKKITSTMIDASASRSKVKESKKAGDKQ